MQGDVTQGGNADGVAVTMAADMKSALITAPPNVFFAAKLFGGVSSLTTAPWSTPPVSGAERGAHGHSSTGHPVALAAKILASVWNAHIKTHPLRRRPRLGARAGVVVGNAHLRFGCRAGALQGNITLGKGSSTLVMTAGTNTTQCTSQVYTPVFPKPYGGNFTIGLVGTGPVMAPFVGDLPAFAMRHVGLAGVGAASVATALKR